MLGCLTLALISALIYVLLGIGIMHAGDMTSGDGIPAFFYIIPGGYVIGGLLVLLALEEIELRLAHIVIFIERAVLQDRQAPNVFPIPYGDEIFAVGVLIEGVFLPVEHRLDVHQDGGHPLGGVRVELEGDAGEAAHLRLGTGIDFLDGEHEASE